MEGPDPQSVAGPIPQLVGGPAPQDVEGSPPHVDGPAPHKVVGWGEVACVADGADGVGGGPLRLEDAG